MTPQRYDIYRLIHKGIRSYLTETLLAVGRMDPHDAGACQRTLHQLQQLLDFCSKHLQHENQFVHPAMERVQPGCAQAMYEHHQHHTDMISSLGQAAISLASAAQEQRDSLAADLYRNLALFVADNLTHMHEEETVNNAILWQGYTDDEILAIEHALVSSLTPEENAATLQWILPSINHPERYGFLTGMRLGAPEAVFNGALGIAQGQLPATDWERLQQALHLTPSELAPGKLAHAG
ncbi:MAG: hemerythrin domain-containing protein [Pseudomonadota bacterium]|nr:hemerythrin domain-containing protein [Pseudomonadota bacterium]